MAKKSNYPLPVSADFKVKELANYEYGAKRKNNPEVGLVTPDTDPEAGKTTWAFDPHLAPELRFDSQGVRQQVESLLAEIQATTKLIGKLAAKGATDELKVAQTHLDTAVEKLKKLQAPFLAWTGKAERTSFEVDTVSLHVHEKIDPARVVQTLRSEEAKAGPVQGDLFDHAFKQESLREAVDFYKHERGWANRLVAGDFRPPGICSATAMKSSVSNPAYFPCSFISLIGHAGKHGARPPVSISTTKAACT